MRWWWIKARQYPKVALSIVGLLLVGVAWVLVRVLGGKRVGATASNGELTRAVAYTRNQIAAANAQAAVEVAVARTKDAAVQKELQETLAIDDGVARREKLAELGRRVRREE